MLQFGACLWKGKSLHQRLSRLPRLRETPLNHTSCQMCKEFRLTPKQMPPIFPFPASYSEAERLVVAGILPSSYRGDRQDGDQCTQRRWTRSPCWCGLICDVPRVEVTLQLPSELQQQNELADAVDCKRVPLSLCHLTQMLSGPPELPTLPQTG